MTIRYPMKRMRQLRRGNALPLLTTVLAACLMASAARAAQVEITGGFDAKENRFVYTVKNNGASPIVQLQFPHFHADSMIPPAGWDSDCTNLVGVNVPVEGGVCTAKYQTPAAGIAPGRSLAFIIHLSTAPAAIGRGDARVTFANGNEETISNVEISIRPRQGFGPAPIIVIAVVFIGYAIYRSRSKRATPQQSAPPDEII